MNSESTDLVSASEKPFTIHLMNTYSSMLFEQTEELLEGEGVEPSGYMRQMARSMHDAVVKDLAAEGIDYAGLRNALTPQRGRKEAAFIFDAKAAGGMYGYDISKLWLPALRKSGPKKASIRHGDILGLKPEVTWKLLEKYLVGSKDFPRLNTEMYYAVYITNLSKGQLQELDAMLGAGGSPYLGYVDCTTWHPLKLAMSLPQFGLRVDDVIVAATHDSEEPLVGFNLKAENFKVLGVEANMYDALLSYRLDQGVPQWATEDGARSLNVLGGDQAAIDDLEVIINESRITYLESDHGQSYQGAGLSGLDPEEVGAAIKEKMRRGLIFNLRFIEGKRDGVLNPAYDTHAFTVQVEFPDSQQIVHRYLIGMKYDPTTHVAEVTTFI